MDERQIECIIYELNEEREYTLSLLKEVEEDIQKETNTKEELEGFIQEKEDLLEDIHDIDCDIASYKEMMDKLYPSEIGLCGYTCDGRCQKCCGGYDPLYEVFSGGDY